MISARKPGQARSNNRASQGLTAGSRGDWHTGHQDVDVNVPGQNFFGSCGQPRPPALTYPASASVPTPRPAPVTYSWAWLAQDYYTDASKQTKLDLNNMQPGQSAWIVLTAKNTGNATWYNSGQYPVMLGTSHPTDRSSQLATSGWISGDRPARLSQTEVPSGGTGTFEFPIKVPSNAAGGLFKENFNLVADGLTWLNNPGFYIQPRVLSYQWAPVSQVAYSDSVEQIPVDLTHLRPSQSAWLVVRAKNTGTATWLNSGPHPMRLGTSGPEDRTSQFATAGWLGPTRPALLLESSVAPGAIGTFEFPIQAPENGSTSSDEHFNLVADGHLA
jgi:hypothetical protein